MSQKTIETLLHEARFNLRSTARARLLAVAFRPSFGADSRRIAFGKIAHVSPTGAFITLAGGSDGSLMIPAECITDWAWGSEGVARIEKENAPAAYRRGPVTA